jgi:hypothetical protein
MVSDRDFLRSDRRGYPVADYVDYPVTHYVGWTGARPVGPHPLHDANPSAHYVAAIMPGDEADEARLKTSVGTPALRGSPWYFGQAPWRSGLMAWRHRSAAACMCVTDMLSHLTRCPVLGTSVQVSGHACHAVSRAQVPGSCRGLYHADRQPLTRRRHRRPPSSSWQKQRPVIPASARPGGAGHCSALGCSQRDRRQAAVTTVQGAAAMAAAPQRR